MQICFIHRVKFELLEAIYSYTGQSDIADITMSKRSKFLAGLQCSQNIVVRHLVSTLLKHFSFFSAFFVYICFPVFNVTVIR